MDTSPQFSITYTTSPQGFLPPVLPPGSPNVGTAITPMSEVGKQAARSYQCQSSWAPSPLVLLTPHCSGLGFLSLAAQQNHLVE